ncbi:aminotransferase class I/II-fold pyridoxal phosphate-dependent enzyme [Actinosynnema sp. NPDC023587]|uniref:aminotransferase class I/II-fold pyridoxal phosphate-dependent enzyme n=1 Tax=Actinosynnema sp. NPDC023587 TaxID=3154695 RepID=UPI00340B1770
MEDDPYGELRYRGEHVPAPASMSDRVLHLGSFSKIGAPGLRLGWLRAPAEPLRTLVIVKWAADLHTSTLDQAAAAYLAANDLFAHVRKLCAAYRERRDAMVAALARDVAFVPGASFHATTPDPAMLRLSFTTNTVERITEGVRRPGCGDHPGTGN